MDINYENVLKYSRRVASRFFKDQDTVQEIAQLTAIQFYMNENRITSEKTDNWLFTVTKNFCLKRIKDSKKDNEVKLDPLLLDCYADNSSEYHEEEIDITLLLRRVLFYDGRCEIVVNEISIMIEYHPISIDDNAIIKEAITDWQKSVSVGLLLNTSYLAQLNGGDLLFAQGVYNYYFFRNEEEEGAICHLRLSAMT